MHGEDSMKTIGRLRWVVDSDREDIANHEAGPSYRDGEDAEQESSSLTQRVMKNLALIRAYEAQDN
jgi:hypothetical protein